MNVDNAMALATMVPANTFFIEEPLLRILGISESVAEIRGLRQVHHMEPWMTVKSTQEMRYSGLMSLPAGRMIAGQNRCR